MGERDIEDAPASIAQKLPCAQRVLKDGSAISPHSRIKDQRTALFERKCSSPPQ